MRRKEVHPLYFAALSGLCYTVQTLLEEGGDVHAQGGYYGNALQAAYAKGHQKVVRLLLDKLDEKVVQLLLDTSADINAENEYKGNALQTASVSGCEQWIGPLLNRGVHANIQGCRHEADDEGRASADH